MLDKEFRELSYAGKTQKMQQEDRQDNARAKIDICKFKQDEAAEEIKFNLKEIAAEKRKYRVVQE